ncbi:hypothetical protein L9F63_016786, partial [Diploptera punctata]
LEYLNCVRLAFKLVFHSNGHSRNSYMSELDSEPDSEYVLEMLARLGQSIIRANDMENKPQYSNSKFS